MPLPSADVGHSFYVACGSSRGGKGDGSLTLPWSSLDGVTAHGPFGPGDQILLRRGTTCTGRLTPAGSGRNGDPITIAAWGSGPIPRINGGGTATRTGALQLTNQHDWTIEDVAVTNHSPDGPNETARSGILVLNSGGGALANIVVRRTVVSDVTSQPGVYTSGGIVVLVDGTSGTDTFSNVLIARNSVHDVGRVGIDVWSSAYPTTSITTVSVSGNRVIRAQGDSILLFGVNGGVIAHNISRDGGHLPPCPQCTTPVRTEVAGIWPTRSSNVAMLYNEVSGENATGGDGEGFDIDIETSGIVMRGNAAHDNGGGALLICGTSGADVRFNVFQNDGGGEITFSCTEAPTGVVIANNTIAVPPGGKVIRRVQGSGTDAVRFENNIVLNAADGPFEWTTPVESGSNLLTGSVRPTTTDTTSEMVTDPGLTKAYGMHEGLDSATAYTPLAGSPAALGAVASPGSPSIDFFGSSVPSGLRGAIAPIREEQVPAAPGAPQLTRSGSNVRLNWTPDPNYPYRIERSDDGGAWRVVVEQVVGGSYVDAALHDGISRYRLVAVGRDGVGQPSPATEVHL